MSRSEALPIKLLILISLLQGLGLLVLHQSIDLKFWPQQSPEWLFALYSVAFIWPTTLLLSLTQSNTFTVIKFTLPFAAIGGVLGYYVGYQATPIEHISYEALLFAFVATMVIATFKALMYSQQYASGGQIYYGALFRWSWRNFLTLALSLLFAGSFWLILLLWGALFDAINIAFFDDLFKESWFYYPAIALANGLGVIIFRNLTHIIDTITRLQQALMKFLLVILVLISLLFLAALAFTGLEPLWKNGGSSLILWMQALMLFFLNAVYQDDPDTRPYHLAFHRFIYIGIAILPIYSLISFYGLSLRVDQYGWTLARCWAFLIWFLLALFPIGYCWGIAKLRDQWLHQLSKVNVAIGLVVLALMLLVNSPLLDFRKIVVNNQLDRLATGMTPIEDFDIRYFKRSLAKPGYDALQTLKAQYQESQPAIAIRINALYDRSGNNKSSTSKKQFAAAIEYLSENPPEELITAIYQKEIENKWELQQTKKYYLLALELDDDNQSEFILVKRREHNAYLSLYYLESGKWLHTDIQSFGGNEKGREEFYNSLVERDVKVTKPKWNEFRIGDKQFQVR